MNPIVLALNIFLSLSLLSCSMFNSSGNTESSLSTKSFKDEVDENLPVVKTFRALPDVTSVGFEWQTPQNTHLINGYVIYRKNKNGKFVRIASVPNAFSTHYYDSKLKQRSEYEYTIASVGLDSKVSKQSSPIKVKTSFIDPVSFVYATKNLAGQIKIFWSPSPNPIVKNYIIEKNTPKGFIPIGSTKNRMLVEYFDTRLDNDKEYEYRIISQSYGGENSLPSKSVTGKTKAPPQIITAIRATQDKPKYISLEWKASEDPEVAGYSVWQSDTPDGEYTRLAFTQGTNYTDRINKDGHVRYYKITTLDRYKLESKMQHRGTKGQTLEPPLSPRILKNMLENNTLTLTWEKINDSRVEKYVVFKQSNRKVSRFDNIYNNSFVDKDLQNGVSYTYYVISIDKLGIESLPSRKITIMIDNEAEPESSNNGSLKGGMDSSGANSTHSIKKSESKAPAKNTKKDSKVK